MKISITKKLAGMVIAGSTAIFTMMPMTAFAQVPEEEAQVCICETKCDEAHINPECPVCSYDYAYCEGKEPEVTETEDATETDAEKEEEPMGPLTPDGNLELVDDYGSLEVGGKQFITVVTKSGNYFYIIIDRDDHGNENVHFLNMVDESDLLALMDDEQVEEYMNKTGVGEKGDQTTVVEDVIEEEPEEDADTDTEDKPVKKNNSGMFVIVLLVIGGAAGGYFYITKAKNKKPAKKSGVDPDADYNEDEDDYLSSIPEDEDEDIEIPEIDDEEIEEDEDEE